MAKYRGLAPWALGVAVLAHAFASATGLTEREGQARSPSAQPVEGSALDRSMDHEPAKLPGDSNGTH
jgi:hypothetical protein